jgi:predicted GNAT family acetyltransferase
LKVITYSNVSLLRGRCRDWLLRDEAINNGIIGAIDLQAEDSSVYAPPFWYASIEDEGEILGVALHSKPDGLMTTKMPAACFDDVFRSVDEVVGPPHRILAPVDVASSLSKRWATSRYLQSQLQMTWNVYTLESPTTSHKQVDGDLRAANDGDQDVARRWGTAYGDEKPAPVDVAEFMLRKLRRKEMYIWDNGGPTTLITLSGFTTNGVRISSVYTPAEHRGHGYASIAVAKMCDVVFEKGYSFVTLAAIAGDPAERIYQRLGFKQIGSRACYILMPLLRDMG